MLSFRDYLIEAKITGTEDPANLTLKEKVRWIRAKGGTVPQHTIENDKLVFDKAIIITPSWLDSNGELIVPIEKCRQLKLRSGKLSSFKNFPTTVSDSGYMMGASGGWIKGSIVSDFTNKVLTSLEGFPTQGLDGVRLGNYEAINYSRVNKYIPRVKQYSMFEIFGGYEGPLLSFLKVDGLTHVSYMLPLSADHQKALRTEEALEILNDHLESKSKSVMDCQEELMDAGLEEYAKL